MLKTYLQKEKGQGSKKKVLMWRDENIIWW
jgi:hypothetical protein